ncbi:MAG: hypothetical protein K0U13_05475 [Chlamydiae bacterium]|nr:hypothetical protein [Chlamydiota bacterium]
MKRLLLPLLLAATPLMALPLNNPMEPRFFDHGAVCSDYCEPLFFDMFDVRFGFYGDYIFNTHMEVSRPDRNDSINTVSVMTNAGEIDVNWRCFDVFCTLGATRLFVESSTKVFRTDTDGNDERLDLRFDTSFSWSVGGRYAILDWCGFGLGVEGQYFRTNPNLNGATDLNGSVTRYLNDSSVTYSAWQVGGGVNYMIEVNDCFSFNPYAGAFWMDSRMSFGDFLMNDFGGSSNQNLQLFDLKKDRQYGWAFGLTIAVGGNQTLTGEARFAGEKAAFVNYQVQF